jgi:peroxiredoxin
MNRPLRLTAIVLLLLAAESPADPADARRIQKSWDLAMEKWSLEARTATTPEARAKVIAERPNADSFARQMWQAIGPALDQTWTVEPAAWFLVTTRSLVTTAPDGSTKPAFAAETETLRKAIETHHLKSPGLIPLCMALAAYGDPHSLSILEKIEAGHPDPKTRGVAAFGGSMILKSLGDDPELMRKRLAKLRKAIIESSDVEIQGTTLAKLAENELYQIRFLAKGRIAPDLGGVDSGGRPLRLSDMKDKIVLLLFWSGSLPEAERVIQITSGMLGKFKGRPFVVLGVNHDPVEKLRSMEADGTVAWRNFSDPENKLAVEYRIGSWPWVYVLDGERKIHYTGTPGSFAELTAEALLSETKP